MQQIIVEQGAGLFPITDDHTGECPLFRPHGSNTHRVIKAGDLIVLEKPVTRLAQLGFAPLLVDLKVKLPLLKRRLAHVYISPFEWYCLGFMNCCSWPA